MISIGQCVFPLGLAARDDLPGKTLYRKFCTTICHGGMKVSGPNSVWRLRNNSINAENTVHELSHERVSNSKKTRYRKFESHSERHFKWSRKLRYQRPFSNNSIKKTSVTYGKSTLIPQPYAHFRLPPLYCVSSTFRGGHSGICADNADNQFSSQ